MFNISQPFFSPPPILKIFVLFLSPCVFREAFSGMVSRRMREERKTERDARVPSVIGDWAGTASTKNSGKAFTPPCIPSALTYKLPAFSSLDASQSSPASLHSHPPFRARGSVTYQRGFKKGRGVQWHSLHPKNPRKGEGVEREISMKKKRLGGFLEAKLSDFHLVKK